MIETRVSEKSLETLLRDLTDAVAAHGFGVLHVHDLKATMLGKGVEFANECRVLEVCQPRHAAAILKADMNVCLALPCRIAVFQDNGHTKIGTLLPVSLMSVFGDDPAMQAVAQQVQDAILAIIEDAV